MFTFFLVYDIVVTRTEEQMVALGGYEEDIKAVRFLVTGSHDLGPSLGFAIADIEGD